MKGVKSHFKTSEGITYELEFECNRHINKKNLSVEYIRTNRRANETCNNSLLVTQMQCHSTHEFKEDSNSSQQQIKGIYISAILPENILLYNLWNWKVDKREQEEPLTHLDCSGGKPTCHSLRIIGDKIEILIGFHTGDIAIHYALENRNQLIHRQKSNIEDKVITCIRWLPNLPHSDHSDKFLVGTANGTILLYNRTFSEDIFLPINDSHASSPPVDKFLLVKNSKQHCNPILKMQSSTKRVNDLKFCKNGIYLAIICDDGYLTILNFATLQVMVRFPCYSGSFVSCNWSPDSKYLCACGEDDMVTLLDWKRKQIVCRGMGHCNFVSDVTFDEYRTNQDRYRIVSVGHDGRILLWDIPKEHIEDMITSNYQDLSIAKEEEEENNLEEVLDLDFVETELNFVTVPSVPMKQVAVVQPVAKALIHAEPILSVACFEYGIVTVCNQHLIRIWRRKT